MVADAVIHHNGNDRRIVGVGNGTVRCGEQCDKTLF